MPNAPQTWLDRTVAILFSTVFVLGLAAVVMTLVVFFPGTSGSSVLVP